VQVVGVANADEFFIHRGLVDNLERQRHFYELTTISHRGSPISMIN
jgi:hypothetical protein